MRSAFNGTPQYRYLLLFSFTVRQDHCDISIAQSIHGFRSILSAVWFLINQTESFNLFVCFLVMHCRFRLSLQSFYIPKQDSRFAISFLRYFLIEWFQSSSLEFRTLLQTQIEANCNSCRTPLMVFCCIAFCSYSYYLDRNTAAKLIEQFIKAVQ